MTPRGDRLRRSGARARHALVARLPPRLRAALTAHVPPWTGRFTVPLPDGEHLRLAGARCHRLLSRLYWEGAAGYEPLTAATWWCLSREAGVIADVGAHVGYYALLATRASPGATVHAFEPFAEATRVLRTLARVNGCERAVRVHEVAVGSQVGDAVLHLPAAPVNRLPTVGSIVDPSALGGPQPGGQHLRRTVAMTTLDATFEATGVDLVKVDVEGAELEVLRGAQRTITDHRPDIIIEVTLDDGRAPASVSWLIRHGYRIYDLTPTGPVPIGPSSLRGMRNLRRSARHRYGEVLASARSAAQIRALAERIVELGRFGRSHPGRPVA